MAKILWKPGQSGNPSGQPRKGLGIARLLSAEGDELSEDGIHTKREMMVKRMYDIATTGDMSKQTTVNVIEMVLSREYGKPLETINFDRTNEDPPSAQELRILLRLREKEEQDEQENDTKGDKPAEPV